MPSLSLSLCLSLSLTLSLSFSLSLSLSLSIYFYLFLSLSFSLFLSLLSLCSNIYSNFLLPSSFLQLVTKGQDIIVRVETPDTMRSGEASNPLRRTGKALKRRESEVQELNDLKCVVQFFESSICLPLSLPVFLSLILSSHLALSCLVLPCAALPCLVFIMFPFSLSLLFPRLSLSMFVSISLM